MPQPKKKPTKKPAANKRKPAAKKPPEPEIQVNRTVTDTPPQETETPPTEETPKTETTAEEQTEESKAELAKAGADRARVVEERNAAAGDARREQVMTPQKEPDQVYEPEREPLEHAGFDHHAAEEQRQAELQAERDEHNERTGDASRA